MTLNTTSYRIKFQFHTYSHTTCECVCVCAMCFNEPAQYHLPSHFVSSISARILWCFLATLHGCAFHWQLLVSWTLTHLKHQTSTHLWHLTSHSVLYNFKITKKTAEVNMRDEPRVLKSVNIFVIKGNSFGCSTQTFNWPSTKKWMRWGCVFCAFSFGCLSDQYLNNTSYHPIQFRVYLMPFR